MNRLLSILTIVILNSFFATVFANDLSTDLSQFLPDHCYFSGHFHEEKQLPGLPQKVLSKGKFYFACDRGLIWQTQSPVQNSLLYTLGKDHYRLDQNNTLEKLEGRSHKHLAKLLNNLMSGNQDYLHKYFEIIQFNEKSHSVTLTSRKKSMAKFIHSLNLTKNEGEVTIQMQGEKSGNSLIRIDNLQATEEFVSECCRFVIPQAALCLGLETQTP